jgi:multicomponent Na+:H+ antiporter subunit D
MAAGNIIYKTKGDRFRDLQGLFYKMPYSMSALVLGAISIIGVPPTCGFFSKWYLISGGIAAGHYGFVVALIFSSLFNVVLFFRIFEIAYFEPFTDHHAPHEPEPIREVPVGMLIPLLFTAAILIVLGIYTGDIVTRIIQFAIPSGIV